MFAAPVPSSAAQLLARLIGARAVATSPSQAARLDRLIAAACRFSGLA